MSNNNTNEPTLEQIKQSLDIVTVAELYGELKKNGANLSYKEDKSIVINPAKQIFSNFNGDITGGSVLDLVMYMEKVDLKTAIAKLKELSSLDTYKVDPSLQVQRKSKAKKKVDFNKLQEWGNEELRLVGRYRPVEYKDKDLKTTHFEVTPEMEKLFETKILSADYSKKIEYIFTNLIGWNKHFKCPSIILRDDYNRIVDLIAYRPIKPDNYESWLEPKYVYKNSQNRGSNFLYPFRKEIETIINREKYLIVGEGIKNGLNALLYSVPFISAESSSNKLNMNLLIYIEAYQTTGMKVIAMFDGDLSGAKAYLNFIKSYYPTTAQNIENFMHSKENIVLKDKSNKDIVLSNYIKFIDSNNYPIKNFLDFDSGLDFVDYLQSEDK